MKSKTLILIIIILVYLNFLGADESIEKFKREIGNELSNKLEKTFIALKEAERKGIATEMLLNKVREGIAKGVSSEKIYVVILDRISKIEVSLKIVNELKKKGIRYKNENNIIEEITFSLELGVSPSILEKILLNAYNRVKNVGFFYEVVRYINYLWINNVTEKKYFDVFDIAVKGGLSGIELKNIVNYIIDIKRKDADITKLKKDVQDAVKRKQDFIEKEIKIQEKLEMEEDKRRE